MGAGAKTVRVKVKRAFTTPDGRQRSEGEVLDFPAGYARYLISEGYVERVTRPRPKPKPVAPPVTKPAAPPR